MPRVPSCACVRRGSSRVHPQVRILLTPGLTCWATRLWVMFALAIALSSLVYSRASPDMAAFAKRHTLWHVVSVAGLSWLAQADARGVLHLPPFSS